MMRERVGHIDDFLIDKVFQPIADRIQGHTVHAAMALWVADGMLCLAWAASSIGEHPVFAGIMFIAGFMTWHGRAARRSVIRLPIEGARPNRLRVAEEFDRLRGLFFVGVLIAFASDWRDCLIVCAFFAIFCHRYLAACKDGGARVGSRKAIWAEEAG